MMEQTQSTNIADLAEALRTVQANLEGAKKDSKNPFFKSDYADLESVWKACREPLTKNGFCVIQTMGGTADAPSIITTLAHTSGQWIRGELTIAPDKRTPQGIGSAITYGRRYSLAAIVGVIQVDDDAEGAMDRDKPKGKPKDTSNAGEDDIPLGGGHDKIDEKQRERIINIGRKNGWPDADIKILVAKHGFESTADVTETEYKKIVATLSKKFEDV